MAAFLYTYRTSDGSRHAGEIAAASREAAFAALRERGIRPIRVTAKDPVRFSAMRRRAVPAAVAAAVLAAGWAGFMIARECASGAEHAHGIDVSDSTRYRAETRECFARLVGEARATMDAFEKDYGDLDMRRLSNYELVEQIPDVKPLYARAVAGQALIAKARKRVKSLFADLHKLFPPESENELSDAQRLYGEIMDVLDARELSLSSRKYALAILDGHRDSWKCKGGNVVFSDERLDKLFKYCLQGAEAHAGSGMRWARDFWARQQQ